MAGVGLMLCRVVEQISIQPMVDVVASIGGIVCFLWLLPILFGRARADGDEGIQAFILGFVLGMSLDTAVHSLTGILDLSSIPGLWPIPTVIALASEFGYASLHIARGEMTLRDEGARANWVLIGPGLLLFVQAIISKNQGWVAQLTHWSSVRR